MGFGFAEEGFEEVGRNISPGFELRIMDDIVDDELICECPRTAKTKGGGSSLKGFS
jgi:hypothetical protein